MTQQALSLAFLGLILQADAALNFITLGDWGGAALNSEHANNAHQVAAQMGKTASDNEVQFVVNVGDNFYYCGIKNTSDFQIATDYLNEYTDSSLQVPWYSALGNHEYGYNVDAQIEFSNKDPTKRWYLPSRYYTKRVALAAGEHLSFIVLDTNPCIKNYLSSSPSGWDPCGSDFPTCAPINEGECKFHQNILTQDCSTQFAWFKDQLSQVPKDDWLIVVGHHPADEIDVEDFLGAMQNHGFDLYLCGHVHTLEHDAVDGDPAFVVSGAGSMVDTADQHNDERCSMESASNSTSGISLASGHTYQQVWGSKTAGFTLHKFSDDFKTLTTDFVSYTGETLHSFSVQRGSKPSPSPTPPGPSPTPAPSRKCSGAGARWDECKGNCTYVHASHTGVCDVSKYGCYDCSTLPSGCPECQAKSIVV